MIDFVKTYVITEYGLESATEISEKCLNETVFNSTLLEAAADAGETPHTGSGDICNPQSADLAVCFFNAYDELAKNHTELECP